MGRPSKICGSDAAGMTLTSPHHQQVQQALQSPSVVHGPGYLTVAAAAAAAAAGTLAHAAGSWRDDPRLLGLQHDWLDQQRRSSEPWTGGDFSDSGTGGLLTDDGASLEPSPKRRHSDSYASSSSPYQFSPAPSSSLEHGDGADHRSRQSSMSSQEAAAVYHAGGGGSTAALWCSSQAASSTAVGPVPTSYQPGVLRMSGGDMIQQRVSPPDQYMHWNMPLPSVKVEDSGGRSGVEVEAAFQAREMSDVIENIIRQQQQQHLPSSTHSLAEFAFSLHQQHQQQQG